MRSSRRTRGRRTESLQDVTARLLPYWYDAIVPDLRTVACVLVVSHGNTLRALAKHLDGIPAEQIAGLNVPTGIPLLYELGQDMNPLVQGGRYLRPGQLPQPQGRFRYPPNPAHASPMTSTACCSKHRPARHDGAQPMTRL